METTTPQSSQLSWRLREEQFRRYETILKKAVDTFPQTFKIDPRLYNLPPSLVTCSARLRDAKLSYLRFNWVSSINRARFLEVENELVVSEGNGYLITGRLDEVRSHFKSLVPQHPIIEKAQGIKDEYSLLVTRDQFFFLCQLAANNVFSKDLLLSSSDPLFRLHEHAQKAGDDYAIGILQEGEKWRILAS
jgi:hypothetical protein